MSSQLFDGNLPTEDARANMAGARNRQLVTRERLIMADKSQATWYVSFDARPRRKRAHARAAETFPNELEAKKFERPKLVDTPNATADTLNPHLPKRTIAARQILEWLEEPDNPDVAP